MTDPPTQNPLLLTSRDAAKALAVCGRTLFSLTKSGQVPCVRIGRAVRYSPADLHAFINGQRPTAPADGSPSP